MQPETKPRELPLTRLHQLKELAIEARSIGARKPVRPEVLSRQFWRAIVATHAGQSLRKDQQSHLLEDPRSPQIGCVFPLRWIRKLWHGLRVRVRSLGLFAG